MKKLFFVLLVVVLLQSASAKVIVDSVNLDPAQVEAGDEVNIYVKYHKGTTTRDVWSGVKSGYGQQGLVEENTDVLYVSKLIAADDISKQYITIVDGTKPIGHLFTGESWTTPFKVKVRDDAPPASYGMEFQVIETDINGAGNEIAASYKFNIPVKGVIKLNIESDTALKIGEVNDFTIRVKNSGGGIARHVTISSNVTGTVKTLDTSAIYVGEVGKGETKETVMRLSVSGNAKTGAYDLPVQMSYVNSSGSLIYMNQTIGLWIEGSPDIDVMLDSSSPFMKGASGTIEIEVINQGFVDAEFLTLELLQGEGYTVMSTEKFYIGALSSDDTDTEEFTIKIDDNAAEGKLPLNVRVTYKIESEDRLITDDSTVNINVLSGKDYGKQMQGNGGFGIIGMLLVIPALVIAYLVLWLAYKVVNLATAYLNRRIFKKV